MRNRCCICKKAKFVGSPSFFTVPSNERRSNQWSEICQMKFSKTSLICADHFLSSDIIKRSTKQSLMPSAVPCINLFPEVPIPDPHVVPEVAVMYVDGQTQTDLPNLEARLQTYRAMNKNLQDEIMNLKRQVTAKKVFTSSLKKILTKGQMRKMLDPGQDEWSRIDISHAIRLHASGPKAYDYLYKNGFPLPPVATLKFWCRQVTIDEGFLTESLGFMKHCSDLTIEDKLCVLVFGAMKVVETYVNDSVPNPKSKSSDYVQVVMAQGLLKSWKRPVFLDFDCQMTKHVLCSVIDKLYQAKFPVVAVVCEMEPTNHKLLQDLGVSKDRPWFPNPVNSKEKVFTFADGSHLLEVVKNHFMDTGLLCNNELLSSLTIKDLIKLNSNRGTSTGIELNSDKRSDEGIGQILATQLFSKTTANSLRHCYYSGVNLYKATETADFISLVNDWFDVLNSTVNTFTTPGKEPFGMALAEQQRTLKRMNKLMSAPIVPNKTELEYFQEGVIMTNTALVMLHDYIKHRFRMTYILTSRINQKELKHLFSVIKNQDDKITSTDFKKRLRNYILDQNMKHFHGIENIINDANNLLTSKNTLASKKTRSMYKECKDLDPEVFDES